MGKAHQGKRFELLAVTGLLGLCVGLLLASGPMVDFCAAAADQLLSPQGYISAVLEPAAPAVTLSGVTP